MITIWCGMHFSTWKTSLLDHGANLNSGSKMGSFLSVANIFNGLHFLYYKQAATNISQVKFIDAELMKLFNIMFLD